MSLPLQTHAAARACTLANGRRVCLTVAVGVPSEVLLGGQSVVYFVRIAGIREGVCMSSTFLQDCRRLRVFVATVSTALAFILNATLPVGVCADDRLVAQADDFNQTPPNGFDEMPDLEFEEFDFDQQGPNNADAAAGAAAAMGTLACIGIFGLIVFGIYAWITYQFYKDLSAVPEQFRELQPGMVWLLLVPIVQLVMIFLVGIKIPQSYRKYFNSIGRTDVGDCGESLGLWMGITTVIGCSPVALVLMIMLLMKLGDYRKQISPA